MRITAKMEGFDQVMRGLEEDIAESNTRAIAEATALLKRDLADDVIWAGLGFRLAKTWRSRAYPSSGASLDPAGFVWTKAPVLIDAFDKGVTIQARGGRWLAVPTAAAGKRAPLPGGSTTIRGKSARITPAGFERRTGQKLRFVYQDNKPSLLVLDTAQRDRLGRAKAYTGRGRGAKLYGPKGMTIVVFILVRQVRLEKRLNVEASRRPGGGTDSRPAGPELEGLMSNRHEQVLQALTTLVAAALPGATVKRSAATKPTRQSAGGDVLVRDGDAREIPRSFCRP